MKVRILIDALARAAEHRPEGYLDYVMSKGDRKGDSLFISHDVFLALRQKYQLGSKVAKVAKPVAKFMDAAFGTNLQNCGGCARREEWLNGGGAEARNSAPSAIVINSIERPS